MSEMPVTLMSSRVLVIACQLFLLNEVSYTESVARVSNSGDTVPLCGKYSVIIQCVCFTHCRPWTLHKLYWRRYSNVEGSIKTPIMSCVLCNNLVYAILSRLLSIRGDPLRPFMKTKVKPRLSQFKAKTMCALTEQEKYLPIIFEYEN